MLTQQKWYGKDEQKVAAIWLDTDHAKRLFLDRAECYVVRLFNDASGNAVGCWRRRFERTTLAGRVFLEAACVGKVTGYCLSGATQQRSMCPMSKIQILG